MCKYCEDKKEVISTSEFAECSLEVFIDTDETMCINGYNHSSSFTEDICKNIRINYCPMCGRKLVS